MRLRTLTKREPDSSGYIGYMYIGQAAHLLHATFAILLFYPLRNSLALFVRDGLYITLPYLRAGFRASFSRRSPVQALHEPPSSSALLARAPKSLVCRPRRFQSVINWMISDPQAWSDCSTKPFKDRFRYDLAIDSSREEGFYRAANCGHPDAEAFPGLLSPGATAGVRDCESVAVCSVFSCVFFAIRESTLRLGCTRRSRVHGLTNVVDRPSRVAGNAGARRAVCSV